MNRVLHIITTINDVYAIRNNNYNLVLNRIDNILEHTEYSISKEQLNAINIILLSNNKNIDREVLSKILHIFTINQQNIIDNQLQFILDMTP